MIGLHPRLFVLAMFGAAAFALCTVASSFAVQWTIDHVILPRFEDGTVSTTAYLQAVGLIVGIGVVRAASVIVRRGFASVGMWRVAQSYTDQVLERLVSQPIAWHRRRPDGDLVARAGVDAESAVAVLAPIPFASSTVLMIVITTIWLFVIDVPLGIVAVVLFPLLIGTNVVYERTVSVHFTRAQQQLGDFSAGVHESFEGVQLVKSYGAEARETRRLSALAGRVRDSRSRAIRIRSWFESLLDVIPSLANIALVVIGAVRVDSGDVTVGELASVVFLFTLLVFPVRLIGYALSELPRSMAAWQRIQEVVDEPLAPDPAAELGVAPPGVGIDVDDATFCHEGESRPALEDVRLRVPIGTTTAVVGPTGAGKTTLAELVIGLIRATTGSVRVAPGPRCVVFQEAFLLAGTVRENLEFGGERRPDATLRRALQLACADFVDDLPGGLETVVGERGVTLSGGQRQRLALARALLRRPSVLVLDDTTSALDPATEARVLDNLRRSLDGTTVLMVASRPSTITLADDVVYMAGGRIAAHGAHRELMATVPAYRELVEAFEADRTAAREAGVVPTGGGGRG
jgi:ABC-type multidrug transport system fused ATPase/permease subunit